MDLSLDRGSDHRQWQGSFKAGGSGRGRRAYQSVARLRGVGGLSFEEHTALAQGHVQEPGSSPVAEIHIAIDTRTGKFGRLDQAKKGRGKWVN